MSSSSSIVAQRAVIASFSSGQWRTVRRHAAETKAENARHGLTDEARVDIKICADPALEEASRLIAAARADHYRLTAPAADRGMRLLPGTRQLEHSSVMQAHGVAFRAAVADFVGRYQQLADEAPHRLKALYVAAHWPDAQRVRDSFSLSVRYLPVPSLGQWDEWLTESASAAADEVKERIGKALRAYAEKLADGEKIFRDSLVGNLAEIADLAVDLNIGGDAGIGQLIAETRQLASVDADTLREDKTQRAAAAARAADLCSMFNL